MVSLDSANDRFDFGRKKYYRKKQRMYKQEMAPKPKIGWREQPKNYILSIENAPLNLRSTYVYDMY